MRHKIVCLLAMAIMPASASPERVPMVLIVGDRMYYGADAIHTLSTMGTRSGVFNRLAYWCFRSRAASSVVYPVLRSCRNLLLKILRKTKINNLALENNDYF